MFWRKKKPHLEVSPSDLLSLASRLGVERRLNVRVRYPNHVHVCKLPEISFAGHKFQVLDISVGGCCLLDPTEVLGPTIGTNLELELNWTTGSELIDARIASRVDQRRHIQFLNLGEKRQDLLKKYMAYGIRGSALRCHGTSNDSSLQLMAAELWSSLQGDSIIVERDMHRLAQIKIGDDQFMIFKEAWPARANGQGTCSKIELEQIILFLANIPQISKPLSAMLTSLEDLLWSGEHGGKK